MYINTQIGNISIFLRFIFEDRGNDDWIAFSCGARKTNYFWNVLTLNRFVDWC